MKHCHPRRRTAVTIFRKVDSRVRRLLKSVAHRFVTNAEVTFDLLYLFGLGRRRVRVDVARLKQLRAEGRNFEEIARELRCGVGTAFRASKSAA
jgi:hypothetical protein